MSDGPRSSALQEAIIPVRKAHTQSSKHGSFSSVAPGQTPKQWEISRGNGSISMSSDSKGNRVGIYSRIRRTAQRESRNIWTLWTTSFHYTSLVVTVESIQLLLTEAWKIVQRSFKLSLTEGNAWYLSASAAGMVERMWSCLLVYSGAWVKRLPGMEQQRTYLNTQLTLRNEEGISNWIKQW